MIRMIETRVIACAGRPPIDTLVPVTRSRSSGSTPEFPYRQKLMPPPDDWSARGPVDSAQLAVTSVANDPCRPGWKLS